MCGPTRSAESSVKMRGRGRERGPDRPLPWPSERPSLALREAFAGPLCDRDREGGKRPDRRQPATGEGGDRKPCWRGVHASERCVCRGSGTWTVCVSAVAHSSRAKARSSRSQGSLKPQPRCAPAGRAGRPRSLYHLRRQLVPSRDHLRRHQEWRPPRPAGRSPPRSRSSSIIRPEIGRAHV